MGICLLISYISQTIDLYTFQIIKNKRKKSKIKVKHKKQNNN